MYLLTSIIIQRLQIVRSQYEDFQNALHLINVLMRVSGAVLLVLVMVDQATFNRLYMIGIALNTLFSTITDLSINFVAALYVYRVKQNYNLARLQHENRYLRRGLRTLCIWMALTVTSDLMTTAGFFFKYDLPPAASVFYPFGSSFHVLCEVNFQKKLV